MAAPPPPPPPPAPTGSIAKPTNAKLLESIRSGTGLKKVPDSQKNDRSTVTVSTKPGGNTAPVPLPSGMRGSTGAAPSLADALKARQQALARGPQSSIPPPPIGASPKKFVAPPPNQNVNPVNNIPKPPSQTSKPLSGNGEINSFPPPLQQSQYGKPLAPSPFIGVSKPAAPLAPPPLQPGNINKPLAPPPLQPGDIPKPLPQPPMSSHISSIPPPPPMSSHISSIPPPPPKDLMPSFPPPVFYSLKPMTSDSAPNRASNIPNSTITSLKNTPRLFAPPPPPPSNSMPTKQSTMLNKPMAGPTLSTTDGLPSKPLLPVRMETTANFDSRFTFADESTFPDPITVSKRSKQVI